MVTNHGDKAEGLVPKLRFPEFRGAADWEDTALYDALQPVSREVAKPGLSYTGLGLRSHGKGTFLKPEENPDTNAMDRLYIVHRDDLIVSITFAWEGAIAIANDSDHGSYVSHRFPTYEFRSGVSSPNFFKYVITDKAFVYRLGVISPGGAGRNRVLNKNDFLRLSILLPSKGEQQKIADCLSSLDAVIAAEEGRLAALRDHKRGLMDQLFPSEGETSPRLRFPEFHAAGEWEWRPLGSLLKGAPAYGVNASAVSYNENLPTYLRITDISEEGCYIHETKVSVDVKANLDNSMLHNDIALVRTGSTVGKAYLHNEDQGELVFAGFLIRVRPDCDLVLPQMLYQFLQTETYWSWVAKISVRSGQPGINGTEYASLMVPLPKVGSGGKLLEQHRIADCLASLDALTAGVKDKIDALKIHKSGLIQKLFPSPVGATA